MSRFVQRLSGNALATQARVYRLLLVGTIIGAAALLPARSAWSQTSLTGSNLAYKSLSSATLSQTGIVGTYLVVPSGGATVNFNVNASGTASPGHMNVVIANSQFGFNVNSTSPTAYNTSDVTLPSGTYFVTVQRDYNNGSNQQFTVNNLSVNTVTGGAATFANDDMASGTGSIVTAAKNNALNAATTYINNFRKGNLNFTVVGAAPGSQIHVKEVNSAFKWGTAVLDGLSTYLKLNSDLSPTALQTNYSAKLRQDFNSVTPENAGKWQGSDSTGQLQSMDRLMAFAAQTTTGMRVRQHNLIWGTQQANDVAADFTTGRARSTNAATATSWMNTINTRITSRINSYVGGTDSITGLARAKEYAQLDVYNETFHTGVNADVSSNANYWKVMSGLPLYGGTGLASNSNNGAAFTADVYNRVQTAVTAASANTKLFMNEYNVLNSDGNNYAQWYQTHIESVRNAGGAVSGVGTQWYNTTPGVGTGLGGTSVVNPARAYATWANLAAQGLPMEVTEFGESDGAPTDEAAGLTTAMTLAFGTPQMTGFTLWGMYGVPGFTQARGSVLYLDSSFTPTQAGIDYEALRASWTTDVTTNINGDLTVTLPSTAFFGDYQATFSTDPNAKAAKFSFDGTTNTYQLIVPVVLGDFNRDTHFNAKDIAAMEAALADLSTYETEQGMDDNYLKSIGDLNQDGTVNNGDLQSMLSKLIAGQGNTDPVPEPATCVLMMLGGSLLFAGRFRATIRR